MKREEREGDVSLVIFVFKHFYRKLKEVKERLGQLKSLMQYYQTTEEKEPDQPPPLSVGNQQQLRSVIFEGLLLAVTFIVLKVISDLFGII